MRIVLRELQEQDLSARVSWMNDVRVNATLNIQLPVTIETTYNWFRRIRENSNRRDFAFVDDKGIVVAMGGFTDINEEKHDAGLYIFVNPDMQGKGYGTEAMQLMCEYGFEQMNLVRIYLHTNSDNKYAIRLYERMGFSIDERKYQEVQVNGVLKKRLYYELYCDGDSTCGKN